MDVDLLDLLAYQFGDFSERQGREYVALLTDRKALTLKDLINFAYDAVAGKYKIWYGVYNCEAAGRKFAKQTAPALACRNFGMLPKRWRCLLDAPFEVSDKCCYYMKKKPLQDYLKQTGRYPIIGILAQESDDRAKSWETHGCNVLEGHHPQSWPLALWTEKDCDELHKGV